LGYIFVSVEDDLSTLGAQDQACRYQFRVMYMIDCGVNVPCLRENSACSEAHPIDASPARSAVKDMHAFFCFVAPAVSYDEVGLIAASGETTALLQIDPGVVAGMYGCQMGNSHRFCSLVGGRLPAPGVAAVMAPLITDLVDL
jgi:hypothetical protein